jgi:hypothetical protein
MQRELDEIRSRYNRGELSNYKLREIIKEKEIRLKKMEEENRKISVES